MNKIPSLFSNGNYRWKICLLLFFATAINYMDRQVLGILAPNLQQEFGWTESQYGFIVTSFQVAYAVGFLFMGNLMDKIGNRLGYMISISFWSLATMLHVFSRSALSFGIVRFMLGLGEAGNFPAAVKTVAEWFPEKERSLATGIFVSGSSIGAIIAPLTVPFIAIQYGWQWTFIITGLLGFLWLIFWMLIYKPVAKHPKLTNKERLYIQDNVEESTKKISWIQLLTYRQTWAFAIGKFFTDPVFSFFFFFLPKFLHSQFGVTLKDIGLPVMAIYIMSDIGSLLGGWTSSYLIKRGWSVNASRKTTMFAAGLCATPVYFASQASYLWVSVGLIGLALAAHQAFSANIFTIVSDMFPQKAVGSVIGIGSMLGAVGGMVGATSAGLLLENTGSYVPLFIIAGSCYLIALLIIHLFAPRLAVVN